MSHAVLSQDEYVSCLQCGSTWETSFYDGVHQPGAYSETFTSWCPGPDGFHVPECTCACCVYGDCGHDGDKTCFDPNRELNH
ncbi:hypothetical protein ACH4Y0_05545 [Streptomyces sp. NPDC020707]|uniref:hypothetical protein n=1 Tax=Streptomyces sp. NPDC020707 TaxID=3365084 RepID=UPI00378EF78E